MISRRKRIYLGSKIVVSDLFVFVFIFVILVFYLYFFVINLYLFFILCICFFQLFLHCIVLDFGVLQPKWISLWLFNIWCLISWVYFMLLYQYFDYSILHICYMFFDICYFYFSFVVFFGGGGGHLFFLSNFICKFSLSLFSFDIWFL